MKSGIRLLWSAVVAFSLSVTGGRCRAQNDSTLLADPQVAMERLGYYVGTLRDFNRFIPQEKVYLHFDNTSYFIGETIWFKAYVVSGPQHEPTHMSGILHVELITQEGTIVDRRKLKIENGCCHGEFVLKDDLNSGYYEIRAYTRYMLNFGMIEQEHEAEIRAFFFNEYYADRFFQESGTAFSRVFPVYAKPSDEGNWNLKNIRKRQHITGLNRPSHENEERPDIRFYPEGGHLVKGLLSRVAFEATAQDGSHIEVSGELTNRRKGSGQFKTSHLGRGDFYVIPDRHTSVDITYKGKTYSYDLPEALDQGYVLTAKQSADELLVDIQQSADLPEEILGLTVICRGEPYVFERFSMGGDVFTEGTGTEARSRLFHISLETLPVGVNQLTLFNAYGDILAERLVFVRHENKGLADVTVDWNENRRVAPFEKIGMNLSVVQGGRPLAGQTLSVSICDEQHREINAGLQNIQTNLLLSSDLYGFIESPLYYFEDDSRKRQYHLDLLMLVQGWRRYDWQQMAGVKPFDPDFKVEKDLRISGRVYPLMGLKIGRTKRMGEGMDIEALLIRDSMQFKGRGKTDSNGLFSFDMPEFDGSGILLLKVHDNRRNFGRKDTADFFGMDATQSLFVPSEDTEEEEEEANKTVIYLSGPKFDDLKDLDKDDGSYYPYEYIPIDNNWIPHVRLLTYTETHPSVQKNEKTRVEVSDYDSDEKYNVSLKDVEVSAKRKLQKLDYSLPAVRVDPMEELNLQMDLGMFTGPIKRSNIGLMAIVRHGVRGFGTATANREQEGISFVFNEYDGVVGFGKDDDPKKVYGINGFRGDESSYYMHRYLKQKESLEETDITIQSIPDSIKWRRRLPLESVERITLYYDQTERSTMPVDDIRDAYSYNFIINYDYFQDRTVKVPVSKGRCVTYYGYSFSKDFNHPDYSKRPLPADIKDRRRTLYWNPDLKTDASGNAHIEFFNNSTCRYITIDAEGLTADGAPLTNNPSFK